MIWMSLRHGHEAVSLVHILAELPLLLHHHRKRDQMTHISLQTLEVAETHQSPTPKSHQFMYYIMQNTPISSVNHLERRSLASLSNLCTRVRILPLSSTVSFICEFSPLFRRHIERFASGKGGNSSSKWIMGKGGRSPVIAYKKPLHATNAHPHACLVISPVAWRHTCEICIVYIKHFQHFLRLWCQLLPFVL